MSAPAERSARSASSWLFWLFAAFACFYLLTAGGHFYASDDVQKFEALDAFCRTGALNIADGWATGRNGLHFSWFPLGGSALMLPGYLAGRALMGIAPQLPAEFSVHFMVAMENAGITAGLVTLLAAYVRFLGYSRSAATFASLSFGLGTMAWPYAKSAWSEPGAATAAFAAVFLLHAASRAGLRRDGLMLAAGTCLALAVSIRQEFALLAPGALVWLVLRHRQDPGRLMRAAALVAVPLVLAAAAALWYNVARYGHWSSFANLSGQTSPVSAAGGRLLWTLRNVWHYTLNPGDGLLWFSPAVWLGIFGARRFWRDWPEAAALMLAALLPLFAFYTGFWGPADWAWGPRFGYVFQPFLLVPIAAAWDAPAARRRALGAFLVCAVAIEAIAALHNFNFLYEREQARYPGITIQAMLAEPARSPWTLALQATPATIAGGVHLIAVPRPAAPLPVKVYREHAQFVPDMWPFLMLLTPLPRWRIGLVVALLLGGLGLSVWRLFARVRFAVDERADVGMDAKAAPSAPPPPVAG